jgi:HAD superfamily hydrolase (TIGR01450 family)
MSFSLPRRVPPIDTRRSNDLLPDGMPPSSSVSALRTPANPACGHALNPAQKLALARGFVIDLDGTLIAGRRVLPGAAALLEHCAQRYVIVSNNSRDTSQSLQHTLMTAGLQVDAERLVLAGEQTIRRVAACYPGARIRLLSSKLLETFAKDQGCLLVNAEPDVIVLGRDIHFSYLKLATIVNELRQGARLVVTNPDLSHPACDGSLIPETGALMQAVIACSGVAPDEIVGKPGRLMFAEAIRRLGTAADATLVIGDNPDTDVLGAARLGMPSLLVGAHPHAEIASLSALFEPAALADQVPTTSATDTQ